MEKGNGWEKGGRIGVGSWFEERVKSVGYWRVGRRIFGYKREGRGSWGVKWEGRGEMGG